MLAKLGPKKHNQEQLRETTAMEERHTLGRGGWPWKEEVEEREEFKYGKKMKTTVRLTSAPKRRSRARPNSSSRYTQLAEGEDGVDLPLLLSDHRGEIRPAMAGSQHHRHRRELRLREDLRGHGDRQVVESTLGGDSRHGTNRRRILIGQL